MIRQFVAEELGDLVPTVASEKMRHQRVADAVILVYGSRAVVFILGIEDANGVPIVQQSAQLSLRPPSPVRVMLHAVRLHRRRRLMPLMVRGRVDGGRCAAGTDVPLFGELEELVAR